MSKAPFPEPQGAQASPGFVKTNPANNDYYVEQFKDDPWYPIIKITHDKLTELLPKYNIAQIKQKFGGLRFYIDYGEEFATTEYRNKDQILAQANRAISYAEAWVDGFEYARSLRPTA